MKLKENFENIIHNYIGSEWDRRDVSNSLENDAEEFAIGFAEWCDDNYFRMGNTSFWSESTDWDNNKKLTTKELLEIYKKTL